MDDPDDVPVAAPAPATPAAAPVPLSATPAPAQPTPFPKPSEIVATPEWQAKSPTEKAEGVASLFQGYLTQQPDVAARFNAADDKGKAAITGQFKTRLAAKVPGSLSVPGFTVSNPATGGTVQTPSQNPIGSRAEEKILALIAPVPGHFSDTPEDEAKLATATAPARQAINALTPDQKDYVSKLAIQRYGPNYNQTGLLRSPQDVFGTQAPTLKQQVTGQAGGLAARMGGIALGGLAGEAIDPLGGGIPGAIIGGASGSVAGQEIEKSQGLRDKISTGDLAIDTLTAMIPGSAIERLGIKSVGGRIAAQAAEHAALGAGYTAASEALNGQGKVNAADIGSGALWGLIIGSGIHYTPRALGLIAGKSAPDALATLKAAAAKDPTLNKQIDQLQQALNDHIGQKMRLVPTGIKSASESAQVLAPSDVNWQHQGTRSALESATAMQEANPDLAPVPTPAEKSAQAIESGLSEKERANQSPQAATALKTRLGLEEAESKPALGTMPEGTPPTPPPTEPPGPAEISAGIIEQRLATRERQQAISETEDERTRQSPQGLASLNAQLAAEHGLTPEQGRQALSKPLAESPALESQVPQSLASQLPQEETPSLVKRSLAAQKADAEAQAAPELTHEPGPFAKRILAGEDPVEEENEARRNAPIDPDAIGGANNPIVKTDEDTEAPTEKADPKSKKSLAAQVAEKEQAAPPGEQRPSPDVPQQSGGILPEDPQGAVAKRTPEGTTIKPTEERPISSATIAKNKRRYEKLTPDQKTGLASEVGKSPRATRQNIFATVHPDEVSTALDNVEAAGKKRGLSGSSGKISTPLLAHLAATAAGGAYGFSKGDTLEDRLEKAAEYALSANVAAWVGRGLYETHAPGMRAGLASLPERTRIFARNEYLKFRGAEVPNLQRVAPKSADKAVTFASAESARDYKARAMAGHVLGEHIHDQDFANRLGGVMVEDNLRGLKSRLQNVAAQEKAVAERMVRTGEPTAKVEAQQQTAQLAQDQADNVVSTIGRESPFKTEKEYQSALSDPEIKAAIQRHMAEKGVQDFAAMTHKETGGVMREGGAQTKAFVNMKALEGEDEGTIGTSSGRGNLQNLRLKGTVHGDQFTGTADKYETDYNELARHMVAGNYAENAKRELYDQMVKDGVAQKIDVGKRPEDAENWKRYELRPGAQQSLWVRKDVEPEFRRITNVDAGITGPLKTFAHAINTLQLAQPIDAAVHAANIVSTITNSPGGKDALTELKRKIPGVNLKDTIQRLIESKSKVVGDDQEIRDQLAKLGEGGMLRPGSTDRLTPGGIAVLDRSARLVMDDLYTDLVKRGKMVDSLSGRRNFVNKLGQYNTRLMTPTSLFLRESGLSPFIVAGKAMNQNAIRSLTGGVSGEPSSASASAKMRATQLGGTLATALALPVFANVLINGPTHPFGRDAGIPFGAIDSGKDDANGNHIYVDPARWTGLRRGLRITGLNAAIQGAQAGRGADLTSGAMERDILTGAAHPYFGPLANLALGATEGESLGGYRVSQEVNKHPTGPTTSQFVENLKGAGGGANAFLAPIAGGVTLAQQRSLPENLARSIGSAAGIGTARPLTREQGMAENAENVKNKQQVQNTDLAKQLVQNFTQRHDAPMTERQQWLQQLATLPKAQQDSIKKQVIEGGIDRATQGEKDLGIKDGSRAKMIFDYTQTLDPDERGAYLQKKVKEGVINATVKAQMNQLARQKQTASSAAR